MEDLAKWLKTQHHGLRTYKAFQKKALALGASDRPHYALYFLLVMLAGRFVEAYDENPLSLSVAEEAHKRLVALADKAARFHQLPAQQQVTLLSEIAASELF